jgi:hypothetical protein
LSYRLVFVVVVVLSQPEISYAAREWNFWSGALVVEAL